MVETCWNMLKRVETCWNQRFSMVHLTNFSSRMLMSKAMFLSWTLTLPLPSLPRLRRRHGSGTKRNDGMMKLQISRWPVISEIGMDISQQSLLGYDMCIYIYTLYHIVWYACIIYINIHICILIHTHQIWNLQIMTTVAGGQWWRGGQRRDCGQPIRKFCHLATVGFSEWLDD